MKRLSDMEKEIDLTLGSLDGVTKAGPGHFFYTRVMARVARKQERNSWDMITGFLAKPVIAGLVVFAIVAANLFAVYQQSGEAKTENLDRLEVSLLEDYSRQVVSFYENENVEP